MQTMKQYLGDAFFTTFQNRPEKFLSCGGRFEVLGNHTDHNHGLCLAATCDLSIYCAASKRDDLLIRVLSEGFGYFEVDLNSLDKNDDEIGKPSSLIRGIVAYLASDYQYGGFDIYIKSEIPSGAGVSSSAAFEMLIAETINVLFNDSEIPLLNLCKASQHAERDFYGKKCGLLDQIGVATGGLVYIDFSDIVNPQVASFETNFSGYQFAIIDTGGSHEQLSNLYEAIPEDMFKVADFFKKAFLNEVSKDELLSDKDKIIETCGLLSYQRALHFFNENQRVLDARDALKNNNVVKLIELMNESRESSTELLHNMFVDKKKDSPLEACELVMKASHNKAGVKNNGGGFAGSIIALIPEDELANVKEKVKERYGKNSLYLVKIRNDKVSEIE